MSEKEHVIKIKEAPIEMADPTPVGLIGLAITTLVLAVGELGFAGPEVSLVIPWVLFLGATGQLITGLMDFKRKDIFGATTFIIYSLLWYTVALTLAISTFTTIAIDTTYYGYGMVGYLAFSIILTVASMWTSKAVIAILIGIDGVLICIIPQVLLGIPFFGLLSGIMYAFITVMSFYTAAGVLLNSMAGRAVLPLGGPVFKLTTAASDH